MRSAAAFQRSASMREPPSAAGLPKAASTKESSSDQHSNSSNSPASSRRNSISRLTVAEEAEGDGGRGEGEGEGGGDGHLSGPLGEEEGINENVVIQELYHRVKKSKIHTDNYIGLFSFICFTSLYLAILYLQADSFKTYQVSSAHLGLLPDGVDGTGGFVFSSTAQVYQWINDSIIQEIWTEPSCGDGICERPDEYMAFGRFGCLSDCGASPNVSQIVVTITNDFSSSDAMAAASWNLCMTYPKNDICWYDNDVTFSKLIFVNVSIISVPDGNWTLTVNAPLGGVVGSIVYNETYRWEGREGGALRRGESLVSWGSCAANRSDTPFGICRQTAGLITECAEKYCTVNGATIDTVAAKSALFVDLAGSCDKDFSALDAFIGSTCEQLSANLTLNSTGDFVSLSCNVPASRRRLQEASSVSPSAHPEKLDKPIVRGQLASVSHPGESEEPVSRRELASGSPSSNSQELWAYLGATDNQRLEMLQVATQRAIFTWVKDSCLSSLPIPVKPATISRFSSFFCTFFGGPLTLDGCAYVNGSGAILYSDQNLLSEMQTIHARMNITRQQEMKFIELFIWALQSVQTFDVATLVAFRSRLHLLDGQVVSNFKDGCPYVAQVLPWIRGRDYITEVEVGQSVSWVWEDDQPHSLQEEGYGDNPSDIFQGMGSGRFVVSRSTICSKENIGLLNISLGPQPCALADPDASVNVFTFTKYFNETGNYTYVDGYDPTSNGLVVVTPNDGVVNDAQSIGYLAATCSPGCALGMLRNGKCDSFCNNVECAFDGGDCSCAPNEFGIEMCTCPEGQTMASDGTCCSSYGVGNNLEFQFYLDTFGANVTESDANFLPRGGPPLYRYVSVANRVVVGMSLSQTRWATESCKDGRFLSLYPNCTQGSSEKSYGVNPVFLPTSQLYDAYFARNDTLYYENFLNFNNQTLRNDQGTPYGFNPFSYQGSQPTFHYIFDINYNNAQATESLQYMIDGFFLDNATKELTVELITYNGIAHYFTLFQVVLTFQVGGKVALAYDVQSISVEPYRTQIDYFRLVLELIFVAAVLWNIIEEVKELIDAKRHHGSFLHHFQQLWNILDFISLSIMTAAIVLWVHYYVTVARKFEIDIRYEIYDIVSYLDPGLFWNIVPPGRNFNEALQAFQRVEAMVYFRTYHIALQGINVLLMVLRILKLMDFQPRMGTITRTLAAAAQDLMHFFILFFVVFMGFAMYGHVVFGRTIKEFRSIAVSLNTCFTALLGNDSVNAYLIELKGWELVAGVFFWWSFIILMVFIILNLLIGIIVDAFVKVRDSVGDAPSMPEEVVHIVKTMSARIFSPLRTDRQLLRQLRALGADKQKDLLQHAEQYGVEHMPTGDDSHSQQEVERDRHVLKVAGHEIDSSTLQAIFERANERQVDPHYKVRRKVDSKLVADVIFNQYGTERTDMENEEEEEEESMGDKMMKDMETMKKDMAELKDLVRSLVQINMGA